MYHYLLYGLTIRSDMIFPQLIPCPDAAQYDIAIEQAKISEAIKTKSKTAYFEIGDSISWFVNDKVLAVIKDGALIQYEILCVNSISDIQTYLLGFGMSMIFHQRNLLAIHCSALSYLGQSILISGESGAGKSTLTTSLLEQGYQLQGDDLVMVSCDGDKEALVYPGFPYQKLCRDAVMKKELPYDSLIYIDEQKDKFLVPYQNQFSTDAAPLKAIYLLSITDEEEVSMTELTGINKLYAMQKCLFLRNFYKMTAFPPAVIKNCISVANIVPIYSLQRPRVGDTITQLLELITKP